MRNALAALLLAALTTCGAMTTPSLAQGCKPVDLVLAEMATTPNFINPRVLAGKPLEMAAELFNSFPPESDEKLTVVLLVDLPDGTGLMLVGRDDLICGGLRLNEQQWRALVNMVEGRGV